MKKWLPVTVGLIVMISLLVTGCGIPQEDYDAVVSERDALKAELAEIQEVYPLNGFKTVMEFKDWITAHVQPETTYIEDAFLAAYKVQLAGMEDGYLMGLDVDTFDDDESAIYITTFVGDELYYWFVEDDEIYGSLEFRR